MSTASTYETVFITSPNLAEEEEATVIETLAKIVTEGGGSMIFNDRMGRRRLAYPIEKCEDGVYTRFLYESVAAVPQELERRIRLSDKVLRSLTVVLERDWAADARVQAKREIERRVEAAAEAAAEAERQAAEAERQAAEAAAEPKTPDSSDPAEEGPTGKTSPPAETEPGAKQAEETPKS